MDARVDFWADGGLGHGPWWKTGKNGSTAIDDDVFGKSVVEERPHLCKCLTVNGETTQAKNYSTNRIVVQRT